MVVGSMGFTEGNTAVAGTSTTKALASITEALSNSLATSIQQDTHLAGAFAKMVDSSSMKFGAAPRTPILSLEP